MNYILAKEVLNCTGLPRSVLYAMAAEGTFPKSIPLSESTVAWLESEVQEWIEARIKERDNRVEIKSKGEL